MWTFLFMDDKDIALGVIMPNRQSHHVVHMISEQQRVGDSNGHVDVGTHFETVGTTQDAIEVARSQEDQVGLGRKLKTKTT